MNHFLSLTVLLEKDLDEYVYIAGVKEVTHGPHLHVVEGVAVQAIVEAGAGAGVGAIGIMFFPRAVELFVCIGYIISVSLVSGSFYMACFNNPFLLSSADRDPYLDLLGEVAVTVTIGDQGVLATAGAPCDLPRHLQRKRSAAPHLMEAGAQGVAAPRIR